MRQTRKVSLGGKLALGHFAVLAATLLLLLIPQPAALVRESDHWYWSFSQAEMWLLIMFTFPCSMFFSHSHHGMFIEWTNERMLVPLLFIFAANSYAVGYSSAYVLSGIRKLWTKLAA